MALRNRITAKKETTRDIYYKRHPSKEGRIVPDQKGVNLITSLSENNVVKEMYTRKPIGLRIYWHEDHTTLDPKDVASGKTLPNMHGFQLDSRRVYTPEEVGRMVLMMDGTVNGDTKDMVSSEEYAHIGLSRIEALADKKNHHYMPQDTFMLALKADVNGIPCKRVKQCGRTEFIQREIDLDSIAMSDNREKHMEMMAKGRFNDYHAMALKDNLLWEAIDERIEQEDKAQAKKLNARMTRMQTQAAAMEQMQQQEETMLECS